MQVSATLELSRNYFQFYICVSQICVSERDCSSLKSLVLLQSQRVLCLGLAAHRQASSPRSAGVGVNVFSPKFPQPS